MNRYLRKFDGVVREVALLSKDPSTKVGAIIVGEHGEVRSIGYNGFVRGADDTDPVKWERPEKYFWAEHAERNAIYNAARMGISVMGCGMIVTLAPCMDCARAIVQSGITSLRLPGATPENQQWMPHWERTVALLQTAGVMIELIPEEAWG